MFDLSPLSSPALMMALLIPLLQAQSFTFEWTYVWLALSGLLLLLAVLAFAYLLVRREWGWLADRPLFHEADRLLAEHVPTLWSFIRRSDVHRWHGLALTVAVLIVFVAGYLFALITEGWTDEEALYAFDQRIYGWLMGAMNERVVSVMGIVTHFGDALVVTLVSLTLGSFLLLRRHRWEVFSLVLSVGGGAAVMHGLKWAFERSRPAEQAAQAAGHSFPSGHTFLAVALYGFVIYLAWHLSKRDAVRIGTTVALTFLTVLIGLSRVILRVHWVSDVAGGFTGWRG